jgi:hypothetical protein
VFYCGKNLKSFWTEKFQSIEIEIRELAFNNFSNSSEYSTFCKDRSLWTSLYGTFVLVFQLDTFIKNDLPYNIDFFTNLNHSFIGGNMIYTWNELPIINSFHYRNFNGGLSLRKRNDMIRIIDSIGKNDFAEDVYFVDGCILLGMSIGNDEPSSHFSVHTIYKDDFFGGHDITHDLYVTIQKKYSDSLLFLGNDEKKIFFLWKKK